MSKIGRNSPCPCGSGKKYKKCCLNNFANYVNISKEFVSNSFEDYIKRNNSTELLKFFALVQVLPENHEKNIRIENIQALIVSNLNDNENQIDINSLKICIDKFFASDYREDPSESCFTENIMFNNGNNIVFTGINHNATEIVQSLIRIIFNPINDFNLELQDELEQGIYFMLYLHGRIAKALNYKRYEYKEKTNDLIEFPNESILKFANLFVLTKEELRAVYDHLKIDRDVIHDFICEISEVKKLTNTEIPPLSIKPFIEYKGKYYLTQPTNQLISLDNYIIQKFIAYNEYEKLIENFDSYSIHEFIKYFIRVGWELIEYDKLRHNQTLWKFDENKYAFVFYIQNSSYSDELENQINELLRGINSNFGGKNEFLFLFVYNFISMTEQRSFRTFPVSEAKFQGAFSLIDLERIINLYSIDKLFFWKFFKAKERLREKGILFASPFHNILTDFEWYFKQSESFFHSDEKYDFLNFSFDVQGNAIIKSAQKKDYHLVPYVQIDGVPGFLPVIKTETYAPIYLSEEVFFGNFRLLLKKYNFPIWLTFDRKYKGIGIIYVEAIAYWLFKIHDHLAPLINKNFNIPFEIIINFEENFINLNIDEFRKLDEKAVSINYEIDYSINRIRLTIPDSFFILTNKEDNSADLFLLKTILNAMREVLNKAGAASILDNNIQSIIDKMPHDNTKMLLSGTSERSIDLDERYIPKLRYIPKADGAIVLEELVSWMGIDIPEVIQTKQEKIDLCDNIISTLIDKIREKILCYNSFEVLEYLMLRHESVLNSRAFRGIKLVTHFKCFGEYQDTIKDYHDYDARAVRLTLSIRCLIEFVVSEPQFGSEKIDEDNMDFILAMMDELTYFGTIKDIITFDLDNPKMGLLPSGRIGVNKDFFDKILSKFNYEVRVDEVGHYIKSFDINYNTSSVKQIDNEPKKQYNSLDVWDKSFLSDWNITLPKIIVIFNELAHYCFEKESSFLLLEESDFLNFLENELNLNCEEIKTIYDVFVLESRGKFNSPPNGYDWSEIFPWRYNRKLSYLLKPIIKLKSEQNNIVYITFSARHLYTAGENLMALFFDGTLKVDNKYSLIKKLVSANSTNKGDEFRGQVLEWLTYNTSLFILPYEFKITTKIADKNYGDIDILAIDEVNNILYSIECKNTKQVKIMYDFWKDVKNFTERQLPKHIKRGKWLESNLNIIADRLKKDLSGYTVKSVLISSSVLPIKFVEDIQGVELTSLSQLVFNNIFNIQNK